jgi:UDP-glucuronate 4-epimerase
MNYLITGGAGFIGSHIIKRLLERKDSVIAIDNFSDYYEPSLKESRVKAFTADSGVKLYRGNICSVADIKKIFDENRIDKVCHLAAQAGVRHSVEFPLEHERNNVSGTINLLQFAKDFKVKNFVYISSGSIYGNSSKFPLKENFSEGDPISPYGASKKAAEAFCSAFHFAHNMPVTILRYFNVYGPWGRPDAAYFKFTKNISEGKQINVHNFGKMKRVFSYVDDIANGTISALDKNYDFETFNLGNDNVIELEYLIECIEKNLGKKAEKNYIPMQAGEIQEVQIDISKAQKMLDFQPKIQIEEGIKKFVAWYKGYYLDRNALKNQNAS